MPPAAWKLGVTGRGVRVAVIDTGILTTHPDLAPNLNLALSTCVVPGETVEFIPGGPGAMNFSHATHVAGIIAAPCTGPVLAAALAFVATKGSVAFGFGIMFAYALGMGLLFFLIGAFSIALPKSGAWMDTVKSVFGVALLAMALVFLKDALPVARPLFSAARGAAFAAAGAAALGVLLGAVSGSFHVGK